MARLKMGGHLKPPVTTRDRIDDALRRAARMAIVQGDRGAGIVANAALASWDAACSPFDAIEAARTVYPRMVGLSGAADRLTATLTSILNSDTNGRY